jgi:hypothetical protein
MKNYYLLGLMICLIFSSCSNDGIDPVEDVATSDATDLKFNDWEEFFKTYNELASFEGQNDLELWEENYNPYSLRKKLIEISLDTTSFEKNKDSLYERFSEPLKSILNEDKEVVIGKDVLKLENNEFVKINGERKVMGTVSVKTRNELENKEDFDNQDMNTKLNLGENQIVGKIRQFSAPNGYDCFNASTGGSRPRRLINELYYERIVSSTGNSSSKLFLRLRLDGEYCSFWKCSWNNIITERRAISFNVQGSAQSVNSGEFLLFEKEHFSSCTTGIVNIEIANLCWENDPPYNSTCLTGNIILSFSGTVSQTHYSLNGPYNWTMNFSDF